MKPQTLEVKESLRLAVADFYEYSMAQANLQGGIEGKIAVFDLVERRMPTNKVVDYFVHEGVKYEQLRQRKYLVNAGLEQAVAYLLEGKGSSILRKYLHEVQGINDPIFLQWAENISFNGDAYALPEGTIFFAQEQQMRVHERFEEAQVFETLLLCTINPQTSVATTANDIAEVVGAGKILLEGGSRRAASPQSALFNSRAARIGGFTASSNVAYGLTHEEKVGGTHGHSYVMLHPSEYAAFKAQGKLMGKRAVFLLDTYNVKEAFETALQIAEEDGLKHIGFRIDSGDLLAQAKWIHQEMREREYSRDYYTLVASDDLTAGKISRLEKEGADVDKYLVGTYVVNPPRPVDAVYKMAAFRDSDGIWQLRGKLSEEPSKSTLPGIKQIYRIQGKEGYYKNDIIALEGEDISDFLEEGDQVEELLVPVIKEGKLVYDFPTIEQISARRKEQLSRFRDIESYEVIISPALREKRLEIIKQYGGQK